MKAEWVKNAKEISEKELNAEGVSYENIPPTENFQKALDKLKSKNGYADQDEVGLSPDMANLSQICAKFAEEHKHADDEVRYVLKGSGVFDIRSRRDEWMRVRVEPGDLISVPAERYHRFYLTEERTIRCVRLFKDDSGWAPLYRFTPEPATAGRPEKVPA